MTNIPISFNEHLPLDLLPITDPKQLRRALVRDRGQRFTEQVAELRDAIHLIIDHNFELAKSVYARIVPEMGSVRQPADILILQRQAAAQLYKLWSFVDGVIYGMTNKVLAADEIEKLRDQWNDKCDEAFGDKVGELLNLRA